MRFLKSCMIAVSMYSRIPVPQFEWEEKNMRYVLAFFPVVGAVIGAMQFLLYRFAVWRNCPAGFYAALACVLPVFITGGIHMDGFCDTVDALCSRQEKERRLEILKDPHTGAFAIIWTAAYFLLCYGGWQLADNGRTVLMVAAGYVQSRAASGIAAVCFPKAKKNGSLVAFADTADRLAVMGTLLCTAAVCAGLQVFLSPAAGAALVVSEGVFFVYYFWMSKKQFGGITGDLEGWFLQCFELLVLFVCVCCRFTGDRSIVSVVRG